MSSALDFLGPVKGIATRKLKSHLKKMGVQSLILTYVPKDGEDEESTDDFKTHMYKDNVYSVLMKNAEDLKNLRDVEMPKLQKRNKFLESFYERVMAEQKKK